MPFFGRTLQELVSDSLGDLAQSTRITRLSPGSKARAILEAVNKRLEEAYDIFDLNIARAFVSSAPGQFLDLIGELLGVTREASIAASVDSTLEVIKVFVESGTFGSINGNRDITLPINTLISSKPGSTGIIYRTTQDTVLPAGSSSVFISAEANAPGSEFNIGSHTLTFHDFTGYSDYLNETLKVTNLHPISSGENIESDANYRFRIVNRVLEAEAANETAVRLAVLSTPGVADALIIPRYRGIGTFGIILQSVTPTVSDALVDNVTANVLKTQAHGSLAFIKKPKETGITLRMTVQYLRRIDADLLTAIEQDLTDSIRNIVNNLGLGDPLLINRLVAELFDVSQEIANFGQPGVPIDELYIHQETRLRDGKKRTRLLGDYTPAQDERVIIEPSVAIPIVLERSYLGR